MPYHQGVVVRRSDRHDLERIVDEVEQLADGLPFLCAALLVERHEVSGHLEGGPELHDHSGTETVRVEVGQPDRHYLYLEVGVIGHRA